MEAPAPRPINVATRPEYAAALQPGDGFHVDGDPATHICLGATQTRARTLAVSLESGLMYCSPTTLVLITGPS